MTWAAAAIAGWAVAALLAWAFIAGASRCQLPEPFRPLPEPQMHRLAELA